MAFDRIFAASMDGERKNYGYDYKNKVAIDVSKWLDGVFKDWKYPGQY